MDEREPPVERETTVISTGERSGGGVIAAIVVLFLLGVLAFAFFGGYFERAAEKVDVDVNVAAPDIEIPDIRIEPPSQPSQPANSTGN